MKNTKMLVALVLLSGTMAFAQREGHRGQRGKFHKDLSVEQLATLKTKRMTLALDLSEKQQRAIMEFNRANVEFRKAKKEAIRHRRPTTEERYAMKNARLDHMIAQQSKLKNILTEEQFDQWKEMQMHRRAWGKRNKQKEGGRG